MNKKTIKITNGTIVHGVGDARPGTIMDVDPRTARQLFSCGKAVPWKKQHKKKPAAKK